MHQLEAIHLYLVLSSYYQTRVGLFKNEKALTEPDYKDVTLINMDAWVKTPDAIEAPIEDSIMMFKGITKRYVFLLKSLTGESLKLEYYHPVRKYYINQAQAMEMSAWHVRHHFAHILNCAKLK